MDSEINNNEILSDLLNLYPYFQSFNLFILFAILIGVIFLIKNIFFYFLIVFESKVLKTLLIDMQEKILMKYLLENYENFLNKKVSDVINNIVIQTDRVRVLITRIIAMIKELLVLVVLIILILLTNPIIAFLTLILFTLFLFIFLSFSKLKTEKYGKFLSEKEDKKIKVLNNVFNSFNQIKIFNSEKYFKKLYLIILESSENFKKYLYVISRIAKYFLETLSILIILLIISISYFYYGSIDKSLTTLSVFVIVAIRLIPVYTALSSGYSVIKFQWPALKFLSNEIKEKNINTDFKNYSNLLIKRLFF